MSYGGLNETCYGVFTGGAGRGSDIMQSKAREHIHDMISLRREMHQKHSNTDLVVPETNSKRFSEVCLFSEKVHQCISSVHHGMS